MKGLRLFARAVRAGFAASWVLLVCLAAARAQAAQPEGLYQKLDTALRELAAADRFSGTALVAKDGEILFEGAYGFASREYSVPNNVDTKFNLASAGKMFTAVAVSQLVEQGKLGYGDKIGKYLDKSWTSEEALSSVTVGDLLAHTSGLGSYFNERYEKSSLRMLKENADFKALIADDKPHFKPGSQWAYSNTGMLLAGVIVEKVSGQNYFDYLRQHIFEPLHMHDSGAFDTEDVVPNLAQGYAKLPVKEPPAPEMKPAPPSAGPPQMPSLRQLAEEMVGMDAKLFKDGYRWQNNILQKPAKGGPAGGSYSTVRDLYAFMSALKSNQLLKPETLTVMTTPKLKSTPYYGYGFLLEAETRGYGHSGAFPGIGTLAYNLSGGYTVIVLSNQDGGAEQARLSIYKILGLY